MVLAILLNGYQESKPISKVASEATEIPLIIGGVLVVAHLPNLLSNLDNYIFNGGKNPPPAEFETIGAFQAKLQSIVDKQGSVWDSANDAYNDRYNPSPKSPILDQTKDEYLNAQVNEYISSSVDTVYGLQVGSGTGFDSFVGKWMVSTGGSYVDAVQSISEAMGTSRSALGAYDRPAGSSSLLEYMMKNDITSPDAVNYEVGRARANGDVLLEVSDIPSAGPGSGPSSGPGTGGAGNITDSPAYKNAMEMYTSLKSTMTAEAYQQNLKDLNNSASKNLTAVQEQIKTLPEDSPQLDALKAQEAQYQAEVQASNDEYKAVTGEDIPVE